MKSQIAAIRARFEASLDVNSNPPLYHPIDIARVRTEDWQITRYLLDASGDASLAFRNLTRTLAWKASIGLHNLDLSFFPTEWYAHYKVEPGTSGHSTDGLPIFTEAYAHQRYTTELEATFKLWVAVCMEAMDRQAGQRGMLYLGDFTQTAIANLDVGLARYRVELLNRHYPLLAKRIVLNNVPWLLKPVLRVIVSFMKAEIREAVVYRESSQLGEFIEAKWRHQDVGGTRMRRDAPKGTLGFRECFERFSVSEEFVEGWFRANVLE